MPVKFAGSSWQSFFARNRTLAEDFLITHRSDLIIGRTAATRDTPDAEAPEERQGQMRLVVFAPHPDDDLIGCGGSLIKAIRAGWSVCVVYLTSGEAGGQQVDPVTLAAAREREARAAAESIGVSELVFLRQPDGSLSHTAELLVEIVSLLRTRRPTVVYLPHRADGHPDHMATNAIVTHAVEAAAGPWFPNATPGQWRVPTVLAYEVWTPIQSPSYFEDTTDVHDAQIAALRHHRSQLTSFGYHELLTGLASYRGTSLGIRHHAEAFEVLRLGQPLYESPPDG